MEPKLKNFYENYDEEGRLLSRSGSVEFTTCERPDMVGISHHTIDIFRKD